jgi:hypothetical protein
MTGFYQTTQHYNPEDSHLRMQGDFDSKTLKYKQGDVLARVRGMLTAVVWKDK